LVEAYNYLEKHVRTVADRKWLPLPSDPYRPPATIVAGIPQIFAGGIQPVTPIVLQGTRRIWGILSLSERSERYDAETQPRVPHYQRPESGTGPLAQGTSRYADVDESVENTSEQR
jgi:hypothetical protein